MGHDVKAWPCFASGRISMPCFADAVNLPATVGIAFRGSACDWVALFVVAVVIIFLRVAGLSHVLMLSTCLRPWVFVSVK